MGNLVAAIMSTNRGRIAVADFDFVALGFAVQAINKPYYVNGDIAASPNTLAFPQTNPFTVVGLRYYYRPFWAGAGLGDIATVNPYSYIPAVFVYNQNNNDTECIGLTRTQYDNIYDGVDATFVSRVQSEMVIGAAEFEADFSDNIDVLSVCDAINPLSPGNGYGRLQIQFTEFAVTPFAKTVSVNMQKF